MRQFNRLRLVSVSSAVVGALMGSYGCQPHKPAATSSRDQSLAVQHNPAPETMPSTESTSQPVTMPASEPSTQAAMGPATGPATIPVTQPTSEPSSQPTTQATSQPVEPPIKNAELPTDDKIIQSDKALAEQFAGMAELDFSQKVTNKDEWPWIWKHQAAVLSASAELDPLEGRFPRLVADAMAQVHDAKGEMDALTKAILSNPFDEFSWNRSLDLHLDGFKELKDKLAYLQGMINAPAAKGLPVPPDVQAHAGYRLTLIHLDRGEDDAANASLAAALRVCPSSVECLLLQYRLLPANATTYQRCECLLALLKANPLQADVSGQLADMIADAGLPRDAQPFYQLSVSTAHQRGDPALHGMLNWVAALFVADPKSPDGYDIGKVLLKVAPNYSPAYFLQLAITRYKGDKDAFTKTLTEAGNVMGNRIIVAMNQLAPKDAAAATTRPISDPSPLSIPDLGPAISQLKASGTTAQKQEFTEAVADLALLEGYFAQQPDAAAKLIDALSGLLPDDSPELVRLRGWNDWLSNKPDDARTKFLTVSTKDPLAELGLIKVMMTNPAEKPQAESMARRLLQDHPSGLLGALLLEQLHSDHVKPFPSTQAAAIETLVDAFPAELFDAATRAHNLYDIRVNPVNVGSFCGDPLLAVVTITNDCNSDLTVGPDGMIKPELIFRMNPDLDKAPGFDAFDNIAGPTVLPAKTGRITQIVRVDQTQLLEFLNTQHEKVFGINGTLSVNRTINGLGGYTVSLGKPYFRKPSGINGINERNALDDLINGRPEQKITALNQMVLFVRQMRDAAPPANGDPAPDPKPLLDMIHKARGELQPAVGAWAAKCEFDVSKDPADQANIVNDLAEDRDWRHRQVALLLVNQVPPAVRDAVLTMLKDDPQASVRADARAIQGRFALPAVAAPTAAPSTEPAAAPTTGPTTAP